MKKSKGVPEMAYFPQHPHRTLLSADPVLGYRIYPPAPPPANSHIDINSNPDGAAAPTSSSWSASGAGAGAGAGAPPNRSRGRPPARSQISSLAGSLSSASGDSAAPLDDTTTPIAVPAPAKHHRHHSKPDRLSYIAHRDLESHSPTPFSDPFRSPAPVSSLADVTALSFPRDRYEEDEASKKALRICVCLVFA